MNRMQSNFLLSFTLLAAVCCALNATVAHAQDAAAPAASAAQAAATATDEATVEEKAVEEKSVEEAAVEPIELKLGGLISMNVSGTWKQVQPKINMIESEFAIDAVEGDENNGRLTMMAASGGIEPNIARWAGQFKQQDGSATEPTTEEKTIDEMTVHVVDITGNFMDSPRGPFGPKVERKDYRMLAAIVQTGTVDYFLKSYGPAKTMDENEDEFHAMIDSIKKIPD